MTGAGFSRLVLTIAAFQTVSAFSPAALPALRSSFSSSQRDCAGRARVGTVHRRSCDAGAMGLRAQSMDLRDTVTDMLELCAVTARGRLEPQRPRSLPQA